MLDLCSDTLNFLRSRLGLLAIFAALLVVGCDESLEDDDDNVGNDDDVASGSGPMAAHVAVTNQSDNDFTSVSAIAFIGDFDNFVAATSIGAVPSSNYVERDVVFEPDVEYGVEMLLQVQAEDEEGCTYIAWSTEGGTTTITADSNINIPIPFNNNDLPICD